MNFNDFFDIYEKNKPDYDKIFKDSVSFIHDQEQLFDINFIITARGRVNFSDPMYKSFLNACKNTDLKICYTIVEHSHIPEHSKFCKNKKINYIWINDREDSLFNKSFCYNIGAIFGPKAKYILFHDIDCLIQSDFFVKLFENIKNKKCNAIQCFTKRRVLYCDQSLTDAIIKGSIEVDQLSIKHPQVSLPIYVGAPGGSIMLTRELFFKVGGYDGEFFQGNSPEDAAILFKTNLMDRMEISDNPEIEIYHMNHPVTYYNNPLLAEMKGYYESFKAFDKDDQLKYMECKHQDIEKYEK